MAAPFCFSCSEPNDLHWCRILQIKTVLPAAKYWQQKWFRHNMLMLLLVAVVFFLFRNVIEILIRNFRVNVMKLSACTLPSKNCICNQQQQKSHQNYVVRNFNVQRLVDKLWNSEHTMTVQNSVLCVCGCVFAVHRFRVFVIADENTSLLIHSFECSITFAFAPKWLKRVFFMSIPNCDLSYRICAQGVIWENFKFVIT